MMAGLLCVILLPQFLYAQNKTISGKITDVNGNPLPGVTISINKTNQGTASDATGQFSLSVPSGATVTISSTGFKSQTVNANDVNAALQIKLEEDIAKLEEVVVTGLTTTLKRRNLANDVGTISSKELNGVAPAQTFDQALNGKVAGAYINANSGAPGGGLSVKLRGVTSVFGNTQPLYVVDGVYMDNTATSAGLNSVTAAAAGGNASNQDNPSSRIADLRPEDIENIEILKGASAAAIYGARAAAGVIIITTKRGHSGKTTFSFSQDIGFAKARKLLGVRQFTEDAAMDLGGSADDTSRAVIEARADLKQQFLDAQSVGFYDYEDEVYGNTAFLRNSVLSMTGGNDKTTFFFSAGQRKEEGIVNGTGYRNTSLRLNVDHKITDNIKLGVSANYVNSSADRGLTGNDNTGITYSISLSSTPNFADLHPDEFGNYPINQFANSNVLQTIALMKNNETVNRFVTGINLDATLQRSAKSTTRFIARGGVDFYNLYTNALFPRELQFQSVNQGTSIQGSTQSLNINYVLSLVNTYNANDNLTLNTSAGFSQETGDYNNVLNVATQLVPGESNVDQAGSLTATQVRNKFENNGIFLQEEVLIKDAITLTGGVRFDNSTNNGGEPGKFYVYPKGGVSVNLTRLNVVGDDFFGNLKLRAAYGQSANFPANGSKFTIFVPSNIGGLQGSIVNVQAGEPDIKPERQTELEGGVDFSILNNKLNFEFTLYSKKIYDFLLLRTLRSSSGFTRKWVNAGDLRNQGIEIGLNAVPVATKDFRWNSTVNFWLNRSKVTKLVIPPVVLGSFGTSLGTFQIEEGKSATQIVGTDAPDKEGVVVLGDAEPRFQMNTFNEITYKNKLSLRFLVHWKDKGDNINLTNLLNDFGGTSADYDADADGNGVPDGPQRIGQFIGGSARGFVQDAGYLRFREIGLYYTFTKIPGNAVRDIRLGVSLNNYITITNYAGYDPEVSNFGTGFSTGVDVDPFPASKRAMFNVTIDF
jgi:TonB-linked SusC/RagA family outer membrane protein